MRSETRQERLRKKSVNAINYPVSVCATNFTCDGNVAFLIRALACFGGTTMHIIGRVPPYGELRRLSGSTNSIVEIVHHKNPIDFVKWSEKNNTFIIASELTDNAENIHQTDIPLNRNIVFVVGNEMDGIPHEILLNANKTIYIPMPGKGYCLNTSQTANILLYEYAPRASTP